METILYFIISRLAQKVSHITGKLDMPSPAPAVTQSDWATTTQHSAQNVSYMTGKLDMPSPALAVTQSDWTTKTQHSQYKEKEKRMNTLYKILRVIHNPIIQQLIVYLYTTAKKCNLKKSYSCNWSGPEVIKLFSCSTQLDMKFFLLINVKMPTVVGILTFMNMKNSIISFSEPKKCWISCDF